MRINNYDAKANNFKIDFLQQIVDVTNKNRKIVNEIFILVKKRSKCFYHENKQFKQIC